MYKLYEIGYIQNFVELNKITILNIFLRFLGYFIGHFVIWWDFLQFYIKFLKMSLKCIIFMKLDVSRISWNIPRNSGYNQFHKIKHFNEIRKNFYKFNKFHKSPINFHEMLNKFHKTLEFQKNQVKYRKF